MKRAQHNKSGKFYQILGEAKNCTNGENDGQAMVLYSHEGQTFVREKQEFYEKFTALAE